MMTGEELAPSDTPQPRRASGAGQQTEPTGDGAETEPAVGPPPGDVEVAPAQRSSD